MIYNFDNTRKNEKWPHLIIFERPDEIRYLGGSFSLTNYMDCMSNEIYQWLGNNVKSNDEKINWVICIVRWDQIYRVAIRFRFLEDAIGFMLRWS